MKSRKDIITAMCYTYRHDYGLDKVADSECLSSGTTEQEREWIWAVMAQIFDNDISPYMDFKSEN
jgi:hypothetical protein